MAGVAKCLRDEFEKVSGKFSEPSKLANAMRHGSLHEDEVVETIRSCLTVLRRYYRTYSPNFIELLMDLLAEKMPLTPKVAYRSPVRLRIEISLHHPLLLVCEIGDTIVLYFSGGGITRHIDMLSRS